MAFDQPCRRAVFVMVCLFGAGHALTLESSAKSGQRVGMRQLLRNPQMQNMAMSAFATKFGPTSHSCIDWESKGQKLMSKVQATASSVADSVHEYVDDRREAIRTGQYRLGAMENDWGGFIEDTGTALDGRFVIDPVTGKNNFQMEKDMANAAIDSRGVGLALMLGNSGAFGPTIKLASMATSATIAGMKGVRDGNYDTMSDAGLSVLGAATNAASYSTNSCLAGGANLVLAAYLNHQADEAAANGDADKANRLRAQAALKVGGVAYGGLRDGVMGEIGKSTAREAGHEADHLVQVLSGFDPAALTLDIIGAGIGGDLPSASLPTSRFGSDLSDDEWRMMVLD